MIFQYLLDLIFNILYGFIDSISVYYDLTFAIPDSVYNFLVNAFTWLAFFVPFVSLVPLIAYHSTILGLRLIMMILGFIKRIPLA